MVAARRTPIGTAGHALAGIEVADLAAPVLAAAAAGLPAPVDEVVLGNCQGPGGNVARVAALAAGLPMQCPAVTVDRQCASGLEAIRLGALLIAAGSARVVLAGGAESASTAPWRSWPPTADAPPRRYLRAPFAPHGFPDPDMGVSADLLAARLGITRERQDEYAALSHELAWNATRTGVFEAELVAVDGVVGDERPRPGMTAARLSRLPSAFSDGGTATAGNSCGESDGAAVVALLSSELASGPALRVRGTAVAADDPGLPGLAIAPAVRKLLTSNGIGVGDIGAIEVTEAFASVALAMIDALGLDRHRVCADGGAIGLGHPWGASGGVLVVRLAARMLAPDGPELGLAACATGGGQAVALLLERVS